MDPLFRTLLGAHMVKNLPAGQETQVPSLGQEDPLEEEMAAHSSVFAWKFLWTDPGGLQSMGSQRVDTTVRQTFLSSFPLGF